MTQKTRPLTIFLFSGCDSPLCHSTHSIILKHLSRLSKETVNALPTLSGSEVNLVISEGRTIRGMNRKFRHIDTSTDVLSFPLGEGKEGVLGEVWVCPSAIDENARQFHQSFENELLRVCIHGILHLGGLDHGSGFLETEEKRKAEPMFVLQEKVHTAVISSKE